MSSQSIVFIDSHVAGYEQIVAQLAPDIEWCLLNPEEDGLAQIRQILSNATALDSIHIISHGGEGSITLGATVLEQSNLPAYADTLADIGAS